MEQQFDQKAINKICKQYGINLLILHGSSITGRTTAESDIDVGILGNSKNISEHRMDIISDFSKVFGDRFDPVFLNGAESMITYNVGLKGIPLYEKQKGFFDDFKATAITRYMDAKKFRDLEKVYLKNAIKDY